MQHSTRLDLTARLIGVDRDHDVLLVGLAENADLGGWQLIFQRADEFDDQDVALGMDTYCIVSGNQEGTIYGGVVDWEPIGNTIDFSFTPDAAAELGMAINTRIRLEGSEAQVGQVVAGLRRILAKDA